MKLLAWMLCALISACASQPKLPPRIMLEGFSFAPLNDKEWTIVKQSPDMTVMGKPGRFSGEIFAMQATLIKLPAIESPQELVRHLESTQRKDLDPKRYRVIRHEVIQYQVHGKNCALSNVEAAERTAASGTGSPVNTMLESLTLICPHPKNTARGINMIYSHRYFPEDVDPQFSRDGALLMQSLAFEPL